MVSEDAGRPEFWLNGRLIPDGTPTASLGIGESGNTIYTNEGSGWGSEGMPAGNYKVDISATQGRSEDNLFGREVVLPQKGKSALSLSRYADPKTSGLTSRVSQVEPNEPVFDLK